VTAERSRAIRRDEEVGHTDKMASEAATVAEIMSVPGVLTLKSGDNVDEQHAKKEMCACCHKVFADEEALRAHWTLKQHSAHDAVCAACGRHFPSYDTLRQHLIGNLPKKSCAEAYAKAGCDKCYETFASEEEKRAHACAFAEKSEEDDELDAPCVALDCEFVGVGEGGERHACARVCVVGSRGEVLLHTWVNPGEEVTDYRVALTGATADLLAEAPSLEQVRGKVIAILIGKSPKTPKEHAGVKHLLVGHGVEHDLKALGIMWKKGLQRDTAKFPLYLRHTHLPFKLRTLAEKFLGQTIQKDGDVHDPSIDAACAMRLYQSAKRRSHSTAKRWFCRTLDAGSPSDVGTDLLREAIDRDGATATTRFYCWCHDRGALARSRSSSPTLSSPRRSAPPRRRLSPTRDAER
jgi:RNA exonuclease 4